MGNYYALKLKAFLLILELRKCQLVPYYRGEFGTQMEPKMAKRVPPLTAKQVENFRPTDRAELTDGLFRVFVSAPQRRALGLGL